MARSLFGLLLAAALVPTFAWADTFEDGVLDELNRARADPAGYAESLDRAGYYVASREGPSAVDEAVDFLRRQRPMAPFGAERVLVASARDLARDQEGGRLGHVGGDGSSLSDRIHRHGQWHYGAAEDISYGEADPQDVVRQLIVDDGVADRGHRANIFDPTYKVAGVACGRHRVYGVVCVIDFAGAVTSP